MWNEHKHRQEKPCVEIVEKHDNDIIKVMEKCPKKGEKYRPSM